MLSESYWSYFLVLESDFYKTTRFVEVDNKNNEAFSLEYTKLLLSIGSEIDVICKELCKNIDSSKKVSNINEYKKIILKKFPKITQTEVTIEKYSISLKPWKDWQTNSPYWWKSYNNVKHNRIINYSESNQKNVIGAMSGLLVLLLYLYRFVNNDEYRNGTKLFDTVGMGQSLIISASVKLPDFQV